MLRLIYCSLRGRTGGQGQVLFHAWRYPRQTENNDRAVWEQTSLKQLEAKLRMLAGVLEAEQEQQKDKQKSRQ